MAKYFGFDYHIVNLLIMLKKQNLFYISPTSSAKFNKCFRTRKTHLRAGKKCGSFVERRNRRATQSSTSQRSCLKRQVKRVSQCRGLQTRASPATASSRATKRQKNTSWQQLTRHRHHRHCPPSLNTYLQPHPGTPNKTNLAGLGGLSTLTNLVVVLFDYSSFHFCHIALRLVFLT